MKKMLSVLAVAAIFASCDKKDKGYEINGKTTGFEDSTAVYIVKISEDDMPQKMDTAYIIKNAFTLSGASVDEPSLEYIQFGGDEERMVIPFILENGKIKVDFNKDKREDAKVSGTKNNDAFVAINEELKPIGKRLEEFQQTNQLKMVEAQQKGDQETINKLMGEMEKIQDEFPAKIKTFIEKNKDSYVSLLFLQNIAPQLEDGEAKKLFDGLSDEVKNTKIGKEMKETFATMDAVAVGQKAPNFTAKTPEGTETSLYENLGKVTIIDFWASWCGPCRQENPHVVKFYEDYKDKGLKIVGVSLDKDADKWKEAIQKDGLVWTQVSNLAFWDDPIAKTYNVRAIPATFILNEKGEIIAKNLRGEELEAKLAELLK